MPVFNPPKELNGIPLSERSRFLLYWPISLLLAHPEPPQPVSYFQQRLWYADDTPFMSSMGPETIYRRRD